MRQHILIYSLLLVSLLWMTASVIAAEGAKPVYVAKPAPATPELTGKWDGAAWSAANTLEIANFFTKEQHPIASDHKPHAQARVLHDDKGLYVHFLVHDRYVRCIETEYHGKVWEDAAVEFFVQPKLERGYFNFEINCGGTLLLSYHENPEFDAPEESKDISIPWEQAQRVSIYHTMPKTVEPEIADPVTWHIEFFIPFDLLEKYVGELGNVAGQEWRANFYKIATNNSHPHLGAWSPILEGASFHSPQFFGVLKFAKE